MRRYDIVKGDVTTVGGVVQAGDSTDLIGGSLQAYEGDPVACPVCNSIGKIVCQGPRISTTGPSGRQAALSDDLCECQCPTPPKLVASQTVSFIEV
ncbi:PAAR domain-containing protein [Burkholderia gladioli]|uniref:PAAR domain-containing protein n=1 Tax=Burkholderia gladioli TaxID=28095 RepID=UPI00163EAEFC|nr:PAAR domain-containing protein [Burkholderia gladioli]